MKNIENTLGPWYIAVHKDGNLIGYWDGETYKIRTKTICLINDTKLLEKEFEQATIYLFVHNDLDHFLPVVINHHVNFNQRFWTESKQLFKKLISMHWPHLKKGSKIS